MNILISIKDRLLNFFDNSNEKLINNIFNTAINIYSEYDKFIKPYYTKNHIIEWIKYIENNKEITSHINGGISTGSLSFDDLNMKENKINITHDVNFIELLKGRNNVIKKWIKTVNEIKKNNIKYVKLKKRKLNNPIKNEDFKEKELLNILSNSKNKFISRLKKLLIDHEIPKCHCKDLINEILKCLYLPESICTSGVKTFFNVLKDENQILLKKADLSKNFCLVLTLSSTKKEHQEIYNKKKKEIKKEIGDINEHFAEYYKKASKIIDPVSYKKVYYISFDITLNNSNDNNFQQFKKDTNLAFEDYYTKLKDFEKNGYFGEYFLTWEEKIKNRQEYVKNNIKWKLIEIYCNPDNMSKLWQKPKWSIENEDDSNY